MQDDELSDSLPVLIPPSHLLPEHHWQHAVEECKPGMGALSERLRALRSKSTHTEGVLCTLLLYTKYWHICTLESHGQSQSSRPSILGIPKCLAQRAILCIS